ncbi:hypothetical protein ACFQH5_20415 [Halomonas salifodinae]|uniref:Uncharacterized protein n=1 Tax=Halomonas salifodinae TaxID=438745 RepID=A0ABW2F119_9GAMM
MSMQELIDAMGEKWRRERSESQMTLGEMIEHLSDLPDGAKISTIGEPHSYRGYYSDLAFEGGSGEMSAKDALAMCNEALGKEFTGYKGGEFLMEEDTPVWVASRGGCGMKIVSIGPDGKLELKDDE